VVLFCAGGIHVHTPVADGVLLKFRIVQWYDVVSIAVLNGLDPV
jgi:hypothetical protein